MSNVDSATQRWIARLWTALPWTASARANQGLSQGVWVVCDQAVVSLANFATTVIVARVCGQYEMGVYGLAVSIFWLAAGIPHALVWTPYMSRAARLSPSRRAVYAGSVTIHALLLAVAIAAVALIAGVVPIPATRGAEWFAPMCLALVPFMILMILREHVRRINLADLRTQELLKIDVPIAIAQIAALLWLAHIGRLSATTALLAIGGVCSLAALWLYCERDRFEFRQDRSRVHWNYNQRFGRWLVFVGLAWLLADASYRWLVGSIHGLESLGLFAAAQSIVQAVNPLLVTFSNMAQAWSARMFAQGGYIALRRFAVRASLLVGGVAGVAFGCLAIVGGPLVQFIFGHEYAGLGGVVAALALGMFAHSMLLPIDAAMVALRRGHTMLFAAAVRLSVAIGAGTLLVWWRDLEGVGYAMALSSAAAAAIEWHALLRVAKNSPAGGGA